MPKITGHYLMGVEICCDDIENGCEICMPTTYKIIRFRQDGDNEVIDRGLTLEEAQAHCKDPSTRGDGWFDGYDEDRS